MKDGAVVIGNESNSSILIRGLMQLGKPKSSFSISIWIKPFENNQSNIIYVVSSLNETEKSCATLLGFTADGNLMTLSSNGTLSIWTDPVIPIDVWTHVVITYEKQSQLKLYINGTSKYTMDDIAYVASSSKNDLGFGFMVSDDACVGFDLINTQYNGAIDEFRIYSRPLALDEIIDLMNISTFD